MSAAASSGNAGNNTTTSSKPNPSDYDGKVTQEQIDELERLRQVYETAKSTGAANLDEAREEYQLYAQKLLIDLSGDKLEPGPDQEPDEGYQKPGGWGSKDKDPNNWKAVP